MSIISRTVQYFIRIISPIFPLLKTIHGYSRKWYSKALLSNFLIAYVYISIFTYSLMRSSEPTALLIGVGSIFGIILSIVMISKLSLDGPPFWKQDSKAGRWDHEEYWGMDPGSVDEVFYTIQYLIFVPVAASIGAVIGLAFFREFIIPLLTSLIIMSGVGQNVWKKSAKLKTSKRFKLFIDEERLRECWKNDGNYAEATLLSPNAPKEIKSIIPDKGDNSFDRLVESYFNNNRFDDILFTQVYQEESFRSPFSPLFRFIIVIVLGVIITRIAEVFLLGEQIDVSKYIYFIVQNIFSLDNSVLLKLIQSLLSLTFGLALGFISIYTISYIIVKAFLLIQGIELTEAPLLPAPKLLRHWVIYYVYHLLDYVFETEDKKMSYSAHIKEIIVRLLLVLSSFLIISVVHISTPTISTYIFHPLFDIAREPLPAFVMTVLTFGIPFAILLLHNIMSFLYPGLRPIERYYVSTIYVIILVLFTFISPLYIIVYTTILLIIYKIKGEEIGEIEYRFLSYNWRELP